MCYKESGGITIPSLDISRSMQDNDLQNILSEGEQTFIDLLNSVDGNALGILLFGAKARVMKPITTIQRDTLNKSQSRASRRSIARQSARRLALASRRGWRCRGARRCALSGW